MTVLVAPHSSNRECYHDVDCPRAVENYTEFSKARAKRAGLRACKYCLGEIDYDERQEADRSYYKYAINAE